ncbi:MAG: MFS transporter [Oscillospiraceae bacterium]|jgi:predicted MFS family arabinose efflux permease|nr:MFS transporter [Oscillospiraceae bacterium]
MKKPNKWFMLFILYLSSFAVSLGQLKIVPIADRVEQFPLLMSVFTLAGIILAIPGGAILSRTGPKNLLLLLLAALTAGNVLGALSGGFALLLVSRIVEGIAFALVIMVGLVMINIWFADGGAGTATGIFTTFAAIGSFVAMNIGLPVTENYGPRAMWWLVSALGFVSFFLVLGLMSVPAPAPAAAGEEQRPSLLQAAKNPPVWILALCHLCIAFLLYSYIATYPQLFSGVYGVSAETANFYNSLNGIFGVPACIIGGWLVNRTRRPYLIALVGCVGAIVTCSANLLLGPATYVLHAGASSLFIGGFALTANLCVAPQLAKSPRYIGYTMSFVNLLYYIGIFASTPLVLSMVDRGGWRLATILMTAVAVAALLLMGVLMLLRRKSAAQAAANSNDAIA